MVLDTATFLLVMTATIAVLGGFIGYRVHTEKKKER
jgi:hypothetical protein